MESEILKYDVSVPEHTPIMLGDRIVGHTTGENEIGYPIKCVLYAQCLYNDTMTDVSRTVRVISMEIKPDGAKE